MLFGLRYGASNPLIDAINVFDILKGLGANPSMPTPPFCVDWRDCQMFVAKIIEADLIAGVTAYDAVLSSGPVIEP